MPGATVCPARARARRGALLPLRATLLLLLLAAAPGHAFDVGDVLVVAEGQVVEVDRSGSTWEVIVPPGGLVTSPTDVAVNSRHELLVLDLDCCGAGGGIVRVDPESGAQGVLVGFEDFFPERMAMGRDDRLFVGGFDEVSGSFAIVEVDARSGAASAPFGFTSIVSFTDIGAGGPGGVSVLAYGDNFEGTVVEVDAETGVAAPTAFFSGSGSPLGIAVDEEGNLFVSDPNAREEAPPFDFFGRIARVDAATGDVTTVARVPFPDALEFGPYGDLFVVNDADPGTPPFELWQVDPATGETRERARIKLTNPQGLTVVTRKREAVHTVELLLGPGGEPEPIHPLEGGFLRVAVLGSEVFDVAEIDPATVFLGRGEAVAIQYRGRILDVDGDGLADRWFRYRVPETGIRFGDDHVCLQGETFVGEDFAGCAPIRTVPICGLGFEVALALPPLLLLRRRRRGRGARSSPRHAGLIR